MWNLFKAEVSYNKWYLFMILAMPLLFAFGMQYGFKLITGVDFFEKYAWSILVGLGSYMFIFIMWQMRHSERRNMQHALLPIPIVDIALARMVFGVLPFAYVLVVLSITHQLLGEIIEVQLYRIFAQLGLLFCGLAFIQLMMDIWSLKTNMNEKNWFLIIGSIGCLIVFISMFAVFEILIPAYRQLFREGEEWMFFLWGLILLTASNFVFVKRSTFLQ
ncbi:MAG: hypothetical protein KKA84_07160 [Bacteroidetes bacterium]|nr:hypothetical protein [Bacteroidota bacterium]